MPLPQCRLCFAEGESGPPVEACRVEIDPAGREHRLLAGLEARTGLRGQTVIAFALSGAGGEARRATDS